MAKFKQKQPIAKTKDKYKPLPTLPSEKEVLKAIKQQLLSDFDKIKRQQVVREEDV